MVKIKKFLGVGVATFVLTEEYFKRKRRRKRLARLKKRNKRIVIGR